MAFRTRNQTIKVAQLTTRAEVGTVDEKARTVDVMFSSGERVLRSNFFGDRSYEELSMDPAHVRMGRLSSGAAPFLKQHSQHVDDVIGVVQSAKIENGKGTATIRFARAEDDPEADKIFRKMKDGIIRNVSVGYKTHRAEQINKGERAATPIFKVVDWEPAEISAVGIGAEAGATTRNDDPKLFNPCVFVTREGEDVTEEEKKALELAQQKLAAEKDELTKRALELDSQKAEIKTQKDALAKRERDAGIKSAVARAKLGDAFEKRMLDSDKSLLEVREMVLDEVARASDKDAIGSQIVPGTGTKIGEEDRDKWLKGASQAILARSGGLAAIAATIASHKERNHKHQNPDFMAFAAKFDANDNGGEFRSMSFTDLARESMERHGVKVRGLSAMDLMERALLYTRDNAGQQTSSDFSVALENVMHKQMVGEYARQSDSWRRFCGVDSVPDFRDSNRYRLGSFGTLDLIGESGEYKHKQIPDAVKQVINTETYGNKISVSRKALVNDDMGAVMASAQRFGRMVALSIEKGVYTLLAENDGLGPTVTYNGATHALMDAAWLNISAGSALSVTGIEADRVLMAEQLDISGNEILDLAPNVMLLPTSLEGEAKVINRNATDPTIVAGNPTNRVNMVAGLFRDIVGSSRLALNGSTHATTRRYLFSDQTPALLVVFLNGVQVPLMDSRPGWDIDGIEWKVRHDFKPQGFDPKGVVTNQGA